MAFLSDIEIAQRCKPEHISVIAKRAHVDEKYVEQYGKYKAKIDPALLSETKRENGKLILVTAITPTPAGEGKTTTTIGLADGLRRIGKDVIVALREPSLGPVFGVKGGAAGGGYSQVVPMEDINLHFTGDFHAIGAANNLLAAMLDNHIQQGNELGIDVRKITWKRCVDMNDRQLRFIVDGMGGKMNGMPREDGFDITVASEIMAVLCLSNSITDLKQRLSRIIVGYTYDDKYKNGVSQVVIPARLPEEKLDAFRHFTDEIRLRARFSEGVKFRLIEEYGPSSFTRLEDGTLLVEDLGFTNYPVLLEWALSFGSNIEVLEPEQLRQDIRKEASRILDRYDNPGETPDGNE